MSTSVTSLNASQSKARATFYSDRIASILAFLPLGVWTTFHLYDNLAAFQGSEAWEKSVTGHSSSLALGITSVVVLAPLAWHTFWGIGRIFKSRPNYPRYGYFANLKYVVQRLSAVGLLAFILAHLWLAFFQPRFVEGHPESFADIAHHMRFHTPTTVVYILGVLAVAYHLANGLHTGLWSWGIVNSRRALKRAHGVAIAFFFVLLGMGWGSIYALWSAGPSVQVDADGKAIPGQIITR